MVAVAVAVAVACAFAAVSIFVLFYVFVFVCGCAYPAFVCVDDFSCCFDACAYVRYYACVCVRVPVCDFCL